MANSSTNFKTIGNSLSESSNLELLSNLNSLENLNSNDHAHAHDFMSHFSEHQQVHLHINLPETANVNFELLSSPLVADETDFGGNTKGFGGGKRKRNNEKNGEKLEEVIHVRAKRGQATDSHSLAERARREKINNRLKCLQDLVPGCYKTMGMAVMLDVIIKYVQSLQNQIEFLSMKLADACGQSDLNIGEMDGMYKFQEANAYQIQEIERMIQREEHGGLSHFQSPSTHL